MTVTTDLDDRPDVRSRVTEAAATLLRDQGADGVTTRAVARAAGVPAPTIFRIFGNKDGLMEAVAEHVMTAYVASKAQKAAQEAAQEDGDPVEDLREAWHDHVEFGLANPDLFVLLTLPGGPERSSAAAAGTEVLAARVRRVAQAGLLAVSQSRAVDLIHAGGTGTVLALLQQPREQRDLALSESMLRAVLDGVLTDAPAPPTSDVRALAVALDAAVPDLPELSDAERSLMREWLARTVTALQEP